MNRNLKRILLSALLIVASVPAYAKHHQKDKNLYPYLAYNSVDLSELLAPPPQPGSAQENAEIDEDLKFQNSRTDDDVSAIQADTEYSVFRFADVMGPKFNSDNLPLTAAFFSRVVDTTKAVIKGAKTTWNRERPPFVDQRIQACVDVPDSSSYPSGHSTAGTTMAIVLSDMVPEKSSEIFARGWLFALHRVMGGAHFRSDIEAGRIAGSVIAQALWQDKDFRADFAASKAELRTALGLPQ